MNSNLENLFYLIRKEDIVLWAGAGFSSYAGYPSGKALAEILYNNLTPSQKKQIDKNLPLDHLAEEFIRLNGGKQNSLIRILKDVFLKKPESLKYHKMLSEIPHIKTIITTNYDNTFELAYEDECCKLIDDTDIAYINDKTRVFKAHGDLVKPETIIIASRHYKNFFKSDLQDNIFWTFIKSLIATKSFAFIGYNLEDINTQMIFDKIAEKLSTHQKQMFLISPSLPDHKINHLAKLGVEYINLRGEEFIEQLMANIKTNIRTDFDNGITTPETFRAFLHKNKLGVHLVSANDKFKVKAIEGLNGTPLKGTMLMEFKENELGAKFNQFLFASTDINFELSEKELNGINFLSEYGVNLMSFGKEEFKMVFQKTPVREGRFDIRFDDGFEAAELDYKIFASKEHIKIIVTYNNTEFLFCIKHKQKSLADFHFETKGPFQKTAHAVTTFSILSRLKQGRAFSIFPDGGLSKLDFEQRGEQTLFKGIDSSLYYYNGLQTIEKFFNIKFDNLDGFTEEDFDDVNYLISYIERKEVLIMSDGSYELKFYDHAGAIDFRDKVAIQPRNFELSLNIPTKFDIRKIILDLGYETREISEFHIVNLDELSNPECVSVKIKSTNGKVKISFNDYLKNDGIEILAKKS
ncbi:MAG TPA: SIR2 family protein [Parafilimonas sp.]|nr:SIR2 family protein [Parafilimonas sp.]